MIKTVVTDKYKKIYIKSKGSDKLIATIPKYIKLPKDYKKDILTYFGNSVYSTERLISNITVPMLFKNKKYFIKNYPHRYYEFLYMKDDKFLRELNVDKGGECMRCGCCGYPHFFTVWISEYEGGEVEHQLVHEGETMGDVLLCKYCNSTIDRSVSDVFISYDKKKFKK